MNLDSLCFLKEYTYVYLHVSILLTKILGIKIIAAKLLENNQNTKNGQINIDLAR